MEGCMLRRQEIDLQQMLDKDCYVLFGEGGRESLGFAHPGQVVDQVESTENVEPSVGLGWDVFDDFSEEVPPTHIDTQSFIIYELIHVDCFLALHHHIILLNHLELLKQTSEWYHFSFFTEDIHIVLNK